MDQDMIDAIAAAVVKSQADAAAKAAADAQANADAQAKANAEAAAKAAAEAQAEAAKQAAADAAKEAADKAHKAAVSAVLLDSVVGDAFVDAAGAEHLVVGVVDEGFDSVCNGKVENWRAIRFDGASYVPNDDAVAVLATWKKKGA